MQHHECQQTPRRRTKMKISMRRRPAGSQRQGGPGRPPTAKKGVSCESVDKNHNLGLREPKPPGGPQSAQEPKSVLQKVCELHHSVDKNKISKRNSKSKIIEFAQREPQQSTPKTNIPQDRKPWKILGCRGSGVIFVVSQPRQSGPVY